MRQAENKVRIEGLLSEINLRDIKFTKDGVEKEAVGGDIRVKVIQKISGEEKELSVPVYMFATKYTKKGTTNPAYESICNVKNDFVSIAAGGEEAADAIRITNADIRMNEFYAQDGRFISYPRINASFINKIDKATMKPEATFVVEMVVSGISEEIDTNGEATGRSLIKGIVPQYGNRVDVIPFYAESEGVIDAVNTYWEMNNTVRANGRLDFSFETKVMTIESGFGEPTEEYRTISKNDLIITGGSQEPLDEEFAFSHGEIQTALTERKARLEAQKDKDMNKGKEATDKTKGFKDLGF
jgi:hypothetical protein